MTLDQVMAELAAKGSRHGAREPFFGVKIADLKRLQKKLKGDQSLALQLYATGNGDAQYLADRPSRATISLSRKPRSEKWCHQSTEIPQQK